MDDLHLLVIVGVGFALQKAMATKSEEFKATTQRSAAAKKVTKKKTAHRKGPGKSARAAGEKGSTHTEKKAAYALEETKAGARPSRKSTRASAHHARNDSSLALRQEARTGSADSRARRSRAKSSRVRGS